MLQREDVDKTLYVEFLKEHRDSRDLKIPRRERLGRLPEVNILYQACA